LKQIKQEELNNYDYYKNKDLFISLNGKQQKDGIVTSNDEFRIYTLYYCDFLFSEKINKIAKIILVEDSELNLHHDYSVFTKKVKIIEEYDFRSAKDTLDFFYGNKADPIPFGWFLYINAHHKSLSSYINSIKNTHEKEVKTIVYKLKEYLGNKIPINYFQNERIDKLQTATSIDELIALHKEIKNEKDNLLQGTGKFVTHYSLSDYFDINNSLTESICLDFIIKEKVDNFEVRRFDPSNILHHITRQYQKLFEQELVSFEQKYKDSRKENYIYEADMTKIIECLNQLPPMCFIYRHYLELLFKTLIFIMIQEKIDGTNDEFIRNEIKTKITKTHNFDDLKKYLLEDDICKKYELGLTNFIKYWKDFEGNADYFRYLIDISFSLNRSSIKIEPELFIRNSKYYKELFETMFSEFIREHTN